MTQIKMKDSGIAWIGEIPDNWESARIDSLYKIRNQKVSDVDYPPLSVTMKGVLPQLENVAKTNAHEDRKLVKKGDFAINSRSDRRGSCGISGYDGSVSLINIVLQPINEMNSIYYNWVFHTVEFADEFYKWGHGIVDDLWTTRWQDMKNIVIPQPPLAEQKEIAEFLDGKCGEIDGLINNIKTQIETLEQYKRSVITEAVTKGLNKSAPLKDSGVIYLGECPYSWKVEKFKFHLKRKTIKNHPDAQVLSLYRDFGVVIKDSRDDNHNVTGEDTSKYIFVNVNDFVVNKMKAWQGSVAISDYEGIVSPAYYVYEITDNNILPHYFHFLLRNSLYIPEFRRLSGGIREGQWDLSEDALNNIYILIPPLAEQKEIAEYLDEKCAEIDKAISDKRLQIETLEEYKKSLIFEYVTGKKQVG